MLVDMLAYVVQCHWFEWQEANCVHLVSKNWCNFSNRCRIIVSESRASWLTRFSYTRSINVLKHHSFSKSIKERLDFSFYTQKENLSPSVMHCPSCFLLSSCVFLHRTQNTQSYYTWSSATSISRRRALLKNVSVSATDLAVWFRDKWSSLINFQCLENSWVSQESHPYIGLDRHGARPPWEAWFQILMQTCLCTLT